VLMQTLSEEIEPLKT